MNPDKINALMASDRLFIIGYFLLLLLIPLNYFFDKARIIFLPLEISPISNCYGIIAGLFILLTFIFWSRLEKNLELSDVPKFIGLSDGNRINQFVLGLFLGITFAVITILIKNHNITIRVANFHSLPYEYLFLTIFLAPIFEEVLYRGLLITRLRYLFDDNKIWNCFILSSSAVLFSWMHPIPYLRLVGGFGFGFVYMWRKDLFLAIITHAVTNTFVILFL